MKEKVIVIGGPTATGKTALSIELAKKMNGEIISADSMLIYQDMDIGTAKPTMEEREGISHYMIDVVEPNERFSVADFKKGALEAIREILKKGKVPIIVGGTGLYIDSLVLGIEYPEIPVDLAYRKELESRIKQEGLESLYREACKIDAEAMQKISPNDQKRICRVLEVYRTSGKTKSQLEIESRKNEIPYDYHVFVLNIEREKLYERINQRVDKMMEHGLINEVEQIRKKYQEFPTAMQGLGYKEVVEYLEGQTTKEEMIEKIKMETRRYAKRQVTWFKKNKETTWLDGLASVQNNIEIILEGLARE